MSEYTKILLQEDEMPTQWYNAQEGIKRLTTVPA